MKQKVRKAVFPVAGLGTRFLPATKTMPKEMLPIIDKPLIHYAVEEAIAAGIEEFIFVTSRGKSAIEDYFDCAYELEATLKARGKEEDIKRVTSLVLTPGKMVYTRQQEPLGLGHAVWCARHFIRDEPFAVLLADDLVHAKTPCLKQMIDLYEKSPEGNMVAVMEIERDQTPLYGILDPLSQNERLITAKSIVEKPSRETAPSTCAVIGRYILDSRIFEVLEGTQSGAVGEIQLTDAIQEMIKIAPLKGYLFAGERFDCGTRNGWLAANIAYALESPDLKEDIKAHLKKLTKTF